MRKVSLFAILILAIFSLSGCGKTNFLQWAAPEAKQDDIESARQAIDEAKYDKAISLVKDDYSSEGRIIYAEALLGKADIDLATILDALDQNVPNDNPLLKFDVLMRGKNNVNLLIESGDIFLSNTPEKKSDQVIGILATMAAHSATLRKAFVENDNDRLYDSIPGDTDYTEDVSQNYKVICGTSNITVDSLTYSMRYIERAAELYALASDNEDIGDALQEMLDKIEEVNDELILLQNLVDYEGELVYEGYCPWGIVRALFGITD